MSEHPIIFTGAMVKAIREGRKIQTRRVVKLPALVSAEPEFVGFAYSSTARGGHSGKGWYCYDNEYTDEGSELVRCPFGVKRDRLWVRESYAHGTQPDQYFYRADRLPGHADTLKWRPSIHMPKAVCRLWLEVTEVRVEQLQDISEEDAIAEGCEPAGGLVSGPLDPPEYDMSRVVPARDEFAALWDSIHDKPGRTWASNPWVWVVSFKVVP